MPPKGGSKVAKKAAAAPVAAAGMPPAIPASDREREEDEDDAPPFIDWKAKLQRPSNAPPGVQPAADSVQLEGEEEEPQAGYPSDKEDDGPGSCLLCRGSRRRGGALARARIPLVGKYRGEADEEPLRGCISMYTSPESIFSYLILGRQ
jgi:hypothetical protein